MKLLAKVFCVLVGVLYIASGFIKAVDPLGFSYKLEEYFAIAKLSFFDFSSLFLAFALCALEIVIGLSLLLRFNLKFWASCSLVLIAFFTLLTGSSAIFDVVKDCGCFGDALKLTPEESFIKDIILLVMSIHIFLYRLYLFPLLKVKLNNTILLSLGLITSLGISFWGTQHLPIIDYRAYKTGNNLIDKMNDGIADQIESIFHYKSKENGKVSTFKTDELMKLDFEKWEFIDAEHNIIKKGKEASVSDFMIIDEFGQDRTMEILNESEAQIMIISYDMEGSNKKAFEDIARLADQINNISFMGLTNATPDKNEELRHEIQAAFPFFSVDQTALKTMIRSNPGIILIKGGQILGKWHYNDQPTKSKIEALLN